MRVNTTNDTQPSCGGRISLIQQKQNIVGVSLKRDGSEWLQQCLLTELRASKHIRTFIKIKQKIGLFTMADNIHLVWYEQ